MTYYSQNHHQPSTPLGKIIPPGIRKQIIKEIHIEMAYSSSNEYAASALFSYLASIYGYGDFPELLSDIGDRFGDEASDYLIEKMIDEGCNPFRAEEYNAFRISLYHMPEPLFLDALEGFFSSEKISNSKEVHTIARKINNLFVARGMVYEINDDLEIIWKGNRQLALAIIEPAFYDLKKIPIPVDGAYKEYTEALKYLRKGDNQSLLEAAKEAAKAVESVVKVLAEFKNISLPDVAGLENMWNALRKEDVVKAEMDKIVTASARLRNRRSAHGSGKHPHQIEYIEAECVVYEAAIAIKYLASRF